MASKFYIPTKIYPFLLGLFFFNNLILPVEKSPEEQKYETRREFEIEREYRRSKIPKRVKPSFQEELNALKKRNKELEDQLRAARSAPSGRTGASEIRALESELKTLKRELIRQTKEKEEAVKFANKLQGEIRVVAHRTRELKEQVQNLSKSDISKKLDNIFNDITRITWLKMQNIL
ncbi:hypothetical protein K9L05_03510 [Candidatus Babeliales bacterium]|nr:hypothetical protein [Candidatus Babeliales bacterium]MCF7899688.1 hypothetical protein [Candidatus Babeliales bacterium]